MTTIIANGTLDISPENLAQLYAHFYRFENGEYTDIERSNLQIKKGIGHYSFTFILLDEFYSNNFHNVLSAMEFYGSIQSFVGKKIDEDDDVAALYFYENGFYEIEIDIFEEYQEDADYYLFKKLVLEHATVQRFNLRPDEFSSMEDYHQLQQLLLISPEKEDFFEALSNFIGSHPEDIQVTIYNKELENEFNSSEFNTSISYSGGQLEIFLHYISRKKDNPEKIILPRFYKAPGTEIEKNTLPCFNSTLETGIEKSAMVEVSFPSLDTKTKTVLPVSFVESLLTLEESMATIMVPQGENWINPCTICENRLLKEVVGNCEVCIFGTSENIILME